MTLEAEALFLADLARAEDCCSDREEPHTVWYRDQPHSSLQYRSATFDNHHDAAHFVIERIAPEWNWVRVFLTAPPYEQCYERRVIPSPPPPPPPPFRSHGDGEYSADGLGLAHAIILAFCVAVLIAAFVLGYLLGAA